MPTAGRRRSVTIGVIAALCLYGLAFAGLSIGGVEREQGWVVVAAAFMLLAAMLLQLALSRARDEGLWKRSLLLWVPFAASVVAVGLAIGALVGPVPDGLGFWALCFGYAAGGQALAELRSRENHGRVRGLRLLEWCAAVSTAAVVLCLLVWAPLLAGVLILLAAPVGLTLLSEDVLRARDARPWPSPLRRGVVIGPPVALAGGLLLWVLTDSTPLLAGAIVLVLFALVGAIASSTQGDVLIVVLLVALVWAESPRPVPPEDALRPIPGETTLVALGDSYMSGEGAGGYFRGTNASRKNECRRAPTAYAHRIVTEQPESGFTRLAFYACSGATTTNVLKWPQYPGEPLDDGSPEKGATQIAQLRSLVRDPRLDVQAVLVSIGGNNAGFSKIGAACVAPRSCVERGTEWLAGLRKVATDVAATYRAVVRAVGDDVRVIAVPYPVPLSRESCDDSLLEDDEHRFLHGFVGELNRAVQWAAGDAGAEYLDTIPGALTGEEKLRICDAPADEIGVHFIALKPLEGVRDQASNPGNPLHNSLHPNERGHERMAEVVADWLSAPPPSQQPLPTFVPADLDQVMGVSDVSACGTSDEPAYCGRDDIAWAITQVGVVLGLSAIPGLIAILGLWLFWLPILARTRKPWSRFGEGVADRFLRFVDRVAAALSRRNPE